MKYTDASAFTVLVTPMDVAIAEHEARCQQLARTIEEKKQSNVGLAKSKQKPTTLDETRLRKAEKDLEEARQEKQSLYDLKMKSWVALQILMESESALWATEEATAYHKPLSNQEGKGEIPLRMRHNLPLTPSTVDDCDLPEINEEVKCLESAVGKSLQAIRTGTYSRKLYSMWVMVSAEDGKFKQFSQEHREALGTGELKASILHKELAAEIRDEVHKLLAPSAVMGCYNAVNATTSLGFLRIPKEDLDAAWRLVTVTKGAPKYELRTSYIVERLKRTLTQ